MASRFALLVLVAALAGCTGASSSAPQAATLAASDGPSIHGVVVDVELVPLADANVFVDPSTVVQTDANGLFRLGPLPAGAYDVHAELSGYRPASVHVDIGSENPPPITLQLEPIATTVPYHETTIHASTIGFAVSTPTSRVTSGLVNQVSGTQLVQDSSVFGYQITADDLATLVAETTWSAQTAFARQLSVNTLDKQGDQTNCVSTKCYGEVVGSSPVRARFTPGVKWGALYEPYPGDAGHGFFVYLMPPFGTADDPALVFLSQRADTYQSFFYHRAAPEDFSALPDA